METEPSPRLSLAAKEAILRRLATQGRTTPVPISKMLRDIRTGFPALRESDEDLIRQIVTEAADHGLAVHFDRQEDNP